MLKFLQAVSACCIILISFFYLRDAGFFHRQNEQSTSKRIVAIPHVEDRKYENRLPDRMQPLPCQMDPQPVDSVSEPPADDVLLPDPSDTVLRRQGKISRLLERLEEFLGRIKTGEGGDGK